MGITPWVVGQTSPGWTIPITQDNNSLLSLTGVTTNQLTLFIYNSSKVRTGTGIGFFTIPANTIGTVAYAPVPADIPTVPGIYYIRVQVNFGGATPFMTDFIRWEIQP